MGRLTLIHRLRRKFRTRDSAYHPQNAGYKWWVLANIMFGTFMAVLDATIVNVALPKIMASFGVGIDKIEWVLTAYLLALALMLPTSSWLADKFGYKRIYFLGLLLFTFGSFLCGLSNDENMLIFSRVIQGLGSGVLMPVGMAIITREFPAHQRGLAIGFWSIAAAASVSFGPLIGGYLVDHYSWQLIFDVNVPIGIVALFITIIIQREYKNKNIGKFDFIGFISASIFLPLTLFALSEGNAASNSQGWSAPYILFCFAIAIIALAVFITAELRVEHPLVDLSLFSKFNFLMCNIVLFFFGMGMFGSTFLLPLYLQNSLGYTAIQAGAVFLPVGFIQGLTAPVVGSITHKINPKIPILTGILLMSFSFYLNYFLSYLTEHSYIMMTLYIRGFGMGILFTALSTAAFVGIPREKMGQASGIINVVRQLGGSFGVAIFATILTTRILFHSQSFGESVNQRSPVMQTVLYRESGKLQHSLGSSPVKAMAQSRVVVGMHIRSQAYIQGISDDFFVACVLSLLGGIPVLFLRSNKKSITSVKIESHE